ncbi:MAG: RNA-dependent RNA polymerase [Jingmen bat rhabdovirus 2]|nr:MAG: RNA-dependent RNA polymerase [Jingmen bat rhabdovirus 2]
MNFHSLVGAMNLKAHFPVAPIPEYVMNSPLTLRNERLYLGVLENGKKVPPEVDLSTSRESTPLSRDYGFWKSLNGIGSDKIVGSLSNLRINWEPTREEMRLTKECLLNGTLYPDIVKDLLVGLGKSFICPEGDLERSSVKTPVKDIPKDIYWQVYEAIMSSLTKKAILRLFTKFMILDEALKWSAQVEESEGNDCLPGESSGVYGWTVGNTDPPILSRWIHLSSENTGIAEDYHIMVAGSSFAILSFSCNCPTVLVGPKSLLLAERDLYFQRWVTVLLTSSFQQFPIFHLPPVKSIKALYAWGDQILIMMGNEGYDVIKELEAFFVARTQHLLEKDEMTKLSDQFWSYIKKSITSAIPLNERERTYSDLYKIIKKLDPSECLEISGLFRHWGHPLIIVEEGLWSVYENATKDLPKNPKLVNTLAGLLTAIALNRYYQSHMKTWPEDTYVANPSSPADLELQSYIDNNYFPSIEQQLSLVDSWCKLVFPPLVNDVDEIPVSALIADKRHAKTRSEITHLLTSPRPYKKSATSSVVESYLRTPHIDAIGFLKEVDRKGIKKEYLIIVLKEKERELKKKGRFFSMMTFVLRLYFVSTEWLIEKYVLPLLPEITMCKDQLEFTQQLLNASERDPEQESVTHHMISIDFEKWNNFQRDESTRTVFEVIDKMFGFKSVVSRTHELFSSCTVIYANALHKIPSNLEDSPPYCWNNHLGGFEGLRQKGWSVIGALLIRYVSFLTRVSTKVLLQGDNQVIIIRYKMARGMSNEEHTRTKHRHCQITNNFLDRLSEHCNSLGLRTKPEETWMSAHLLYYGKIALIDGTLQSLFLKRVCRSLFVTNEVAPSLSNSLGSLNTTLLSGCYQVHDPLCVYVLYWILGPLTINYYMQWDPLLTIGLYQTLQRVLSEPSLLDYVLPRNFLTSHSKQVAELGSIISRPNWSPSKYSDQSLLTIDLLLRDASLGGIGGAGPLRYVIRQFPDPVSEALAGIKLWVKNLTRDDLKRTLTRMGFPLIAKRTNYEILIQDPASLNLSGSIKNANLIRSHVKQLLVANRKTVVANTSVREALSVELDYKEPFIDFLMSIRPIFPRFLGELYSASPLSLCESITNKLVSTRSAFRLASSIGPTYDLKEKIVINEIMLLFNLVIHWKEGNLKIWECSGTHAQDLRDKSWGVKIEGMTVPHPCEQWKFSAVGSHNRCLECNENRDEFLLIVPDNKLRGDPSKIPWECGEFSPYLGGHTRQKRIAQTEIELDTSSPLLKNIIRLFNCSNWAFKDGSRVQEIIVKIISAYIPSASNFLYHMIDITSGNLIHRFANSRISDGALLGVNPNISSHSCITSNNLGRLGRGEENYVIMFQAVFIYFQLLYGLKILYGSLDPYPIHIHPSCKGCMMPASSFTLEASGSGSMPSLESLLTYTPFEGEFCNPPIPSTFPILRNPFAIGLDRIWVNPIALLSSSRELEEPSSTELEDTVYLGASLAILSKVNFSGCLDKISAYSVTVTLMNSLSWVKLKDWLLYTSLLVVLASSSPVTFSPGRSLTDIYRQFRIILVDTWSRVASSSFGVLLSHSVLEMDALEENVVHHASFPAKNPQVGISGIQGLINEIRSSLNPPQPRKISVPGDLNTGGIISLLSLGTMALRYTLGLETFQDLNKGFLLYKSAVIADKRYRLDTFSENKNVIYQDLEELMLLGGVIQFIRKDLKSLSSLIEPPLDKNQSLIKYLSPALEKVIPADICWEPGITPAWGEGNPPQREFIASPLMHLFRPVWHSANGSVKICSVLKRIPPRYLHHPAMIGDGNGGFSRVLVSLDFVETLWFNSLPETKGLTDQQGAGGFPSALASNILSQEKIINLKDCLEGVTDITDPHWPSYVRVSWERARFSPSIIISDAEFYGADLMVKLIYNLSLLRDICPVCIVKMHLGGVVDIRFILEPYTLADCKIYRSAYSNMGRYEVYVMIIWDAKHSNPLRGHDIPSDVCLMSNEEIFKDSLTEQFIALDTYRFPTRSKGERRQVLESGLTLRRVVGESLHIPISWFILREDDISSNKTPPLAFLCELLYKLEKNKHSYMSLIIHHTDNFGSNRITRSSVLGWVSSIIAISIFVYGLYRDGHNYQRMCQFYNKGAYLSYSAEPLRLWISGVDSPSVIMEFSRVELKPVIHDVIRYLGSIWWLNGQKHFKMRCKHNHLSEEDPRIPLRKFLDLTSSPREIIPRVEDTESLTEDTFYSDIIGH